jgi:hypothetical protein
LRIIPNENHKATKMRNLRLQRTFTKENDTIGQIKPKGRCKNHPKHNQSPGVCSLCLSEKLIQLSSFGSHRRTRTFVAINDGSLSSSYVSSLSSSCYSSSSVSSCASPLHCFCFNSEGKRSRSLSIFLLSGQHEIIKSKSFSRRRECEGGVMHGNKRSCGFWFKLFGDKRKRIEGT